MSKPLDVIILWHMHQPCYKDPLKNEYILPWTYLHAVKDYFDMPAIVEETPGARAVFNLVPSLIEQLEDYANETATDSFLEIGKAAPSDLDETGRIFLLENFFSANCQRMIDPNRRYLELFRMAENRGNESGRDWTRRFSDQDLLDLQVWFYLAWTGEVARRRYPVFSKLIAKGENFSPSDKEALFSAQNQIIRQIIPLYRKLREEGRIEISVSPYYHPILPLLCDSRVARASMPQVTLPTEHYCYPEDARAQIKRSVDYFAKLFGAPPDGMWPSEGAVSKQALEIIAECGLSWAASDEEVLSKSLAGGLGENRKKLYQSWMFSGKHNGPALFFRDRLLSDLIGFTYSSWDAKRAADDLLERLRTIKSIAGEEGGAVSIILDGENAWEYYAGNAYDFLRQIYASIAAEPGLNLTTCSDVLLNSPPNSALSAIHPGSWINANYGVWIGNPEENMAWGILSRARKTIDNHIPETSAVTVGTSFDLPLNETTERILRLLYAAEGSDWFWWYGDDHSSSHKECFDQLFRRYLMEIYHLLGIESPRELLEPIGRKRLSGLVREPAAMIRPNINGRISDYFEWMAAGFYDLSRQGTAMHSSDRTLQGFYFGFDKTSLFFRIDGSRDLDRILMDEDILNLNLTLDREYRLSIRLGVYEDFLLVKKGGQWVPTCDLCSWKTAQICEISVPLNALNLKPQSKILAALTLVRNEDEIGRWPPDAPLTLYYAGPEIEMENWLI